MANYIAKVNNYPIGGNQFDSGIIKKDAWLAAAFTMSAAGNKTFDISSYIPNDGYDYEARFSIYSNTNGADLVIYVAQGTSAGSNNPCITYRVKPSGGNVNDAGNVVLPILASGAKKVTLNFNNACGNTRFGITVIRRINNNDSLSNRIQKATIPSGSINFGGDINDGQWVGSALTLLNNVSMAASSSRDVSFSSYLPNDGHIYDVVLKMYGTTGSTSGNWGEIVASSANISTIFYLGRNITRTASNARLFGNATVPVGTNRKLTIHNNGSSGASTIQLRVLKYKRIAKPQSGNYIAKINDKPIGGDIFSGKWVYKRQSILNNASNTNTSGAGKTSTYTVTNYLPDNTYQYEVLAYFYSRTGATSGYATAMTVGDSVVGDHEGSYLITREAKAVSGATLMTLALKQDSSGKATVSVWFGNGNRATNIYFGFYAYRRIGSAGVL